MDRKETVDHFEEWLPEGARAYARLWLNKRQSLTDGANGRFQRLFYNKEAKVVWKKIERLSKTARLHDPRTLSHDVAMLSFHAIPDNWRLIKPLELALIYQWREVSEDGRQKKKLSVARPKGRFRTDKHIQKIKGTTEKLIDLISPKHPFVSEFFRRCDEFKGLEGTLAVFRDKISQFSSSKVRYYNAIFKGAAKVGKSSTDNAHIRYYCSEMCSYFLRTIGKPCNALVADLANIIFLDEKITEENVKQYSLALPKAHQSKKSKVQ